MIKIKRSTRITQKQTNIGYLNENTRNENDLQYIYDLQHELENQDKKLSILKQKSLEQEMSVVFDCKYTPKTLKFRENESKQIAEFVEKKATNKDVKFLMISGLPGCGKTLVVNKILDDYDGIIRSVRLNAMTFKSLDEFWQQLMSELEKFDIDSLSHKKKDQPKKALRELLISLAKDKRDNVIMIDEFECLFKDQEAFGLFSLCTDKGLGTKIIGISNDTEFLYKQKFELPPLRNIVFEAYSLIQIQQILQSRFLEVGPNCKIENEALKFCVNKAVSIKGADLRNVLESCKKILMNKSNNNQIENDSIKFNDEVTITKNDLEQINQKITIFTDALSLDNQVILLSVYLAQIKEPEKDLELKDIQIQVRYISKSMSIEVDTQNIEDSLNVLQAYNLIELKECLSKSNGFKKTIKKVKLRATILEVKRAYEQVPGLKMFV